MQEGAVVDHVYLQCCIEDFAEACCLAVRMIDTYDNKRVWPIAQCQHITIRI